MMRASRHPGWLSAIRRYLAAIALGNLLWEFAQLPLYAIWRTGTWRGIAFAALHCTASDVLIATAALVTALVVVGSSEWPERRWSPVMATAVALGVGYTGYSEHLNTAVRKSWAYSGLMPIVPGLGIGAAPLAQWLIVPPVAFAWARRRCAGRRAASGVAE